MTTPTPPTLPPSLTPTPVPVPVRNDRATFSGRVDAFVTWITAAVTEFGELATNIYDNAIVAYNNTLLTAADVVSTEDNVVDAIAQVVLATTQANNAAASALTAVNAPGTNATSTTSLTISEIAQSLTIQTGKDIVISMFVTLGYTAAPANYMHGIVTAYNPATGALDVLVSKIGGSGTYADWTVSLSSPAGIGASEAKLYFIGQL